MDTEAGPALHLFLVQTVEQSCSLSPLDERVESGDDVAFEALVAADFYGPMGGRILLGVTGALMARIAAGFLEGSEVDDRMSQVDALRELSNILCGNLLPYVAGSRAVFRIGSPEQVAQEAWAQRPDESLFAKTSAVYPMGGIFLRVFLKQRPATT